MQVLSFSSPKLSTRNIVYLAMMMAMQIVLSRFSFGTPWLKISPAFFATILMGYYFGPNTSARILPKRNHLLFCYWGLTRGQTDGLKKATRIR